MSVCVGCYPFLSTEILLVIYLTECLLQNVRDLSSRQIQLNQDINEAKNIPTSNCLSQYLNSHEV